MRYAWNSLFRYNVNLRVCPVVILFASQTKSLFKIYLSYFI